MNSQEGCIFGKRQGHPYITLAMRVDTVLKSSNPVWYSHDESPSGMHQFIHSGYVAQ